MAEKKVSVIISNRNDITMLVVTVRSCMEELKPLGAGAGEIVIVDNSDEPYYERIKSALPTGYFREKLIRLYRQERPCLFTARELAAEKAVGEYIICLDSHMIVGRDMIKDLYNFMETNISRPIGFAHAPITWAHQHDRHAKIDRDLSLGELGPWGLPDKSQKRITWKGMPWICRRDWFLDRDKGLGGYGALADHRISWGGGDMHIGTKPWLLGFENWGLACSPGIHIGPFPKTDRNGGPDHTIISNKIDDVNKYRVYSDSGNFPQSFGFLLSCYILGGVPMMERNKAVIKEKFGRYLNVEKWWDRAIELGQAEREWLLERQVMSYDDYLKDKPWQE